MTKVAFIFSPAEAGAENIVEGLGVIGLSSDAATGRDADGTTSAGALGIPPLDPDSLNPPNSPSTGPSVDPFHVNSPLGVGNGFLGIDEDETKYRITIPCNHQWRWLGYFQ